MRPIFVVCFFLCSCFSPPPIKPPIATLKQVSIVTDNRINKELAISIDFVQVYSKNLFNILKKMNAKKFLAHKNQLLFDYPDSFKLWSMQVVPNQITKCYQFPQTRSYWGMLVFVHFFNGNANRAIFSNDPSCVALEIHDGYFKIMKQSQSNSCMILER
jgi:hypothetical protein